MSGFFSKLFGRKGKNKIVRSLPKSSHEERIVSGKKKRGSEKTSGSLFLRIFTWLLILCFVGVVGYMLFFSPFLTIDEISIRNEENIDEESLRAAVAENLDGKYLNLAQKNNFILASKKNIKADLKNRFKRISDVEITKEFPNKITVEIKEVRAGLIFCGGDSCWVIDEKGNVFAKADFVSNELGEQDMIILRNINPKNVAEEDVILEEDLVRFVMDLRSRLEGDLGIMMKKEIMTPALISGDLRLETAEGWKIYFNKNLGVKKSFDMLKAILERNIDRDKRANLEYIDLRVNNKAYYKLKKTSADSESEKEDSQEDK
jgi:cell division septal protein FtsQ